MTGKMGFALLSSAFGQKFAFPVGPNEKDCYSDMDHSFGTPYHVF
jgi:hypothetical protein